MMSGRKELTTGEMIDQLKLEQVAIRVFEPFGRCSDAYTMVRLDKDNDVMVFNKRTCTWSYERLTGSMIKSSWIIVEAFVPFTDWYKERYGEVWHEDYAGLYAYALDLVDKYEQWCKEIGTDPVFDG